MNSATLFNTKRGVVVDLLEKGWLVKGLTKENVSKNISLLSVMQMLEEKMNGQNEQWVLHRLVIHF